jgi:short-subunit dehydrogenase
MSVLILGATSPISRALAAKYAAQGRAIFLADLDEADRIAADLRVRYGVKACSGFFDAKDFDSHPGFVAAVEKEVGPIEICVVAFGAMGEQTASEDDFAAARNVIDINYTGAASASEAVVGAMLTRGSGSLIGICSVSGDRGRASNYFYGSAKGAFALYLQGLRNRLFKGGVHVLTVKLGFVDTGMTFGMETGLPMASPDAVAAAIVRAESRRLNVLYYPPFWIGIMGVIRAIPEEVFKRLSL